MAGFIIIRKVASGEEPPPDATRFHLFLIQRESLWLYVAPAVQGYSVP